MNKKNVILTAMILLTIAIVFSFMPCIFNLQWMKNVGLGSWEAARDHNENIFSANTLMVLIFLLLAIGGLVALVMQYIGNKTKIYVLMNWLPVVSGVIFALLSVSYLAFPEDHRDDVGYFYCTAAWGFYIESALLIIVSIISIFLALGKFKDKPVSVKTPTIIERSSADELKKYKELLDSGVISQEEFDKKKKQIIEG